MAEIENSTSVEKEKSSKKKIIMLIAALLVLCIAIFAVVKAYNLPAKQLEKQLNLGNRYLEEMDYEQAIVAFDKAIEIDPKNVDAYLGKADAYVGLGDMETAITVLEKGYELTENDEILRRLEELQGSGDEAANAETDGDVAEETAVGESGLPYFELGFSPEDFTIAGYSVMDGDHLDDVERAAAEVMPDWQDIGGNYEGWGYHRTEAQTNGEYSGLDLSYRKDENHGWGVVYYFIRDTDIQISICTFAGEASVYEYPLYKGKVTPNITSYEETLESLGIGSLIQAVEEKADGEGLEFESQYGIGYCFKNEETDPSLCEYSYDIDCYEGEQEWTVRVEFSDNVLSGVNVWRRDY